MIAALPMYDRPETAADTDALWVAIRDRLRARNLAAPERLTRDASLWETWEHPGLTLGQTCGLPYRRRLHGRVGLIGALDYALPGAPRGYYYSHMVCRREDAGDIGDFARRTLAFNGQDSQSGWAAAQNEAGNAGFAFTRTLHTGAHRNSAAAIADGRADIAAIDAETWRLIERHEPEIATKLRIIRSTEPTPGLPLITAPTANTAEMAEAIEDALAELAPAHRAALDIAGFVRIPAEAYLAVRTPGPLSQDTRAP